MIGALAKDSTGQDIRGKLASSGKVVVDLDPALVRTIKFDNRTQWSIAEVKAGDLAKALGVSKSAVLEAGKNNAVRDLIDNVNNLNPEKVKQLQKDTKLSKRDATTLAAAITELHAKGTVLGKTVEKTSLGHNEFTTAHREHCKIPLSISKFYERKRGTGEITPTDYVSVILKQDTGIKKVAKNLLSKIGSPKATWYDVQVKVSDLKMKKNNSHSFQPACGI